MDRMSVKPELKIFSTLAVMGAMHQLTMRYEQLSGTTISTDFAPTRAFIGRIESGDTADVAILTKESVEALISNGTFLLGSRVDLALSFVGIAASYGAKKRAMESTEDCKRVLLAARSICYSRIGASGTFFADLIQRLGIADEIIPKARIIQSGLTAELVASGEVELAIQQVSELMLVPGIEVVGRFPPELQTGGIFSAAVFSRSEYPEASRGLLAFLSSLDVQPVLRAAGLEPVPKV